MKGFIKFVTPLIALLLVSFNVQSHETTARQTFALQIARGDRCVFAEESFDQLFSPMPAWGADIKTD